MQQILSQFNNQTESELVVCWDEYGYGYDHSYCLIFSRQG